MDIKAQFEQLTGLILAAEDWSDQYKRDSETFGMLVKAESKLNRSLIEFFKGVSDRSPSYINWYKYYAILQKVNAASDPFEVDVIVNYTPDDDDSLAIKVVYDPINLAVIAGVSAGEKLYKLSLTDASITDSISSVTKSRVAYLVGKQVDSNGNIVDNPKAKYRISDVTRKQIQDSIRTSLSLGENQEDATKRMQKIIKDPKRASKIASTEAVNGYQGGLFDYAKQTGAIGKEWQTVTGACYICVGNANVGVIGIDESFPSGDQAPSAHPYDRCGLRFDYPA